jgi:hypothetical protein
MIPDKLFINLRILSKIPKNGRISRSSNGIVSIENDNSYSSKFQQAIRRFFTNDSRRQSVFEINSIINECIDCLNVLSNSKHMNENIWKNNLEANSNSREQYKRICEELELVLTELTSAKGGLENLKFTYANDVNIASQLDVIILKIYGALKEMTSKLNFFKSFLPNSNIALIMEDLNE